MTQHKPEPRRSPVSPFPTKGEVKYPRAGVRQTSDGRWMLSLWDGDRIVHVIDEPVFDDRKQAFDYAKRASPRRTTYTPAGPKGGGHGYGAEAPAAGSPQGKATRGSTGQRYGLDEVPRGPQGPRRRGLSITRVPPTGGTRKAPSSVRQSIPTPHREDPGSNPGRATKEPANRKDTR